jgi:nitric oxide reductase activation protein
MADSQNETMARLARLETAVVHMTDVLVLQSERMDAGFRAVSDRLDVVTDRLDVVTDRLEAVTDRLDRLIAVTLEERTLGIERLASIEHRLARLEQHVGI